MMKTSSINFIKRLKRQKEDALEYVINRYMPLVKAIATKVLYSTNPSAIEECVNDVFLLVWQHAKQFQGEADDFQKWIGTITKYKAIDLYRQASRQIAREQSDEKLAQVESSHSTEVSIIKQEERNTVLMVLSQLGELDCEVFVMKYYLDMTNSEVAEQLGLTKAAIDNRLYRGKKVLASNDRLKELFI